MSVLTRWIERPERALLALGAAQLAFWTLAPALSHSAPPLDVVEMYAWGREYVVATFKHPNLPGLVLETVRRVTGQAGWPAYLVSQLCVVTTFWAVFALGRDLIDAQRALAGTLMLTGVYFFSWTTPEFNHNVAQIPLWALVTLLMWRGVVRGGWLTWALLGAFAGLSLWAKYSSVMLLAPAAAWLLWDAEARKRLATPGPWIALAVFALVAAPQVMWLFEHQFQPFAYAARRASDGGPLAALEFLLTQVANHLPMLLLLWAAGLFGKRAEGASAPPDQRAMRYLLLLGLGPVLLTALGGVFGAGLRSSWGAPMFNLSGLIVVALLGHKINAARLKRLAIGAGVLIVTVSALYFAHMRYGAAFTNDPLRGNWPQAELSRQLEGAWVRETNAPLAIVAGDIWTAGLVGLQGRNPPSVLINGDFVISPWVTRAEARSAGVLVVWRADEPRPPHIGELSEGHEVRSVGAGSDLFPNAPPIVLDYVIIPPEPRAP